MQKLRYFTDEELSAVTHPDPDDVRPDVKSYYSPKLLLMLDAFRHRAGLPVILTSGFRCASYNKKIGGSPSSSHLDGLAVDIQATGSHERYHYLRAALACGFSRIGIGKGFIHLDVDDSKTSGVVWLY